jgi:hypothetical protein
VAKKTKKRTPKPDPIVKKFRYVQVEWVDAISYTDWREASEAGQLPVITTRGWLIRDEEKFVTIAGSIGQDGQFGEIITIPKCWTDIVDLKVT